MDRNAFALVLLVTASCSAPQSGVSQDARIEKASEEVVGSMPGRLPPAALQATLLRAKQGDIAAMERVEQHFGEIGDLDQYLYWLNRQIALESASAMQRKAAYMADLHTEHGCKEAEDLLTKAIDVSRDSEMRESLRQELLLNQGRIVPEAGCIAQVQNNRR